MIIHTDGGCLNNDQLDMTKRKMVSVAALQDGTVVVEKNQEGGSNNIAELLAVKEALLWALDNGHKDVEIITDSRNNLAWVFGQNVGKKINDRTTVLNLRASITASRFLLNSFKLTWQPREVNVAGYYIERKYQL